MTAVVTPMRKKGRRAVPAAYRAPAVPFTQHAFTPTVSLLDGLPRIFIDPQAYEDMCHFVDIADGEVGWMGTVRELPGGYHIEEVFLFHQDVSAVTTDLLKVGKSKLIKELRGKGEDDKLDRLYFWGHSHVNMGTTPSQKDEDQIAKFEKDGCPYMIMGIFNKHGRAEFTFFDFEAGVRIDDVRWRKHERFSTARRVAIEADMAEKLTQAAFVDYAGTGEQPPYVGPSAAYSLHAVPLLARARMTDVWRTEVVQNDHP